MAENESTQRSAGGGADSKKEGIRLLLVDDETAYVNVLSNRLRKRGFEVTASYSGTEAIQKMRGHEFDVAILDLKMADMDGIEVLKIVKLLDPRMQVIMLTGHGSAAACEQGMQLGAYDYLMKPCELEDLVAKIREAFGKKSS
ncbi:MAG: response regulator [Desulfobacteraceae bacterium]|nr:MAG: response regulator [Desulfobacteraceae bacterium]